MPVLRLSEVIVVLGTSAKMLERSASDRPAISSPKRTREALRAISVSCWPCTSLVTSSGEDFLGLAFFGFGGDEFFQFVYFI